MIQWIIYFNGSFMLRKMYSLLLGVQGYYTLLTAISGLVDIDSFMALTGPKNDIWLVKTVSVVLLAVAVCLLTHKYIN